VSRVACDIYLYLGRWRPRNRPSWKEVIHEALDNAFDYKGRVVDVAFQGIEESSDGRRLAIQVDADWWGIDPGDCRDAIHEALSARLQPEYESQIEVEVTCLSDPDDMDDSSDDDWDWQYDWEAC